MAKTHSLTAPPSPVLNDEWYDETNKHRKRYDGAAWEDMDASGEDNIPSSPPPEGWRVVNLWVNAQGKLVVEYDDGT